MFHIKSGIHKPDIDYLFSKMRESMGIGIAIKNLDELKDKFKRDLNFGLKILRDSYGIENPNSSQQVIWYFKKCLYGEIADILDDYDNINKSSVEFSVIVEDIVNSGVRDFGKLDIDEDVKECVVRVITETSFISLYRMGKWTANSDALTELAENGRQDAKDILKYRKDKKFLDTVDTLIGSADKNGFIHPNVSKTITNRVSYSSPALMNIPKELLWTVVGPRKEGNILVSVDIKNQEPWILINMLGIERLRNLLSQSGDLYKRIYQDIFGREPNSIERAELKTVWNAMTYGMSKFGVRNVCKHIDADEVYNYFNSFREFKRYKSKCKALAKQSIDTINTYFGTELCANSTGKGLDRTLMDIKIQGTGTDILSLLVKHFYDMAELCDVSDRIHIYYTRHDECIIEIDSELIDETSKDEVFKFIKTVFEHKIDNWEPFQVEIKELSLNEAKVG